MKIRIQILDKGKLLGTSIIEYKDYLDGKNKFNIDMIDEFIESIKAEA